jgi:hypothetical protein
VDTLQCWLEILNSKLKVEMSSGKEGFRIHSGQDGRTNLMRRCRESVFVQQSISNSGQGERTCFISLPSRWHFLYPVILYFSTFPFQNHCFSAVSNGPFTSYHPRDVRCLCDRRSSIPTTTTRIWDST